MNAAQPAKPRAERSTTSRRALAALALAAGAAVALATVPTVSDAAPRLQRVTTEQGHWVSPAWNGCDPVSVTIPTGRGTTSVSPAKGASLSDDLDELGWRVADVARTAEAATWTLAPGPDCHASSGVPSAQQRFVVRSSTRRYVIQTKRSSGVTHIGGLRMNSKANIRTVRQAFGAPSRVRGNVRRNGRDSWRSVHCNVDWNRYGLRIIFASYAGSACTSGWVQAVHVTKPSLWAIRVGQGPAITSDSSIADLAKLDLAERIKGNAWGLDTYWSPYGDEGWYPSVIAITRSAGGPIAKFEAWVGLGGD